MARITHIAIASAYSVTALFVCAMLIRFEIADVAAAWNLSAILGLTAGHVHVIIARELARDGVAGEMRELATAKRRMVDEIAALRARITDLEVDVVEDGDARHAAIVAEMRTLEDLVHAMGERMSEGVAEARRQAASGMSYSGDRAQLLANVRDALADGRVDLHLQPIVSLPQRRTFYFESFSRLRDDRGDVIMPAEWLKVAEPAGLVAEIDNLLLFRCVQIVRRLAEKERRIGIFCNISPVSLSDEEFFPQFLDFVRRNSDLAGSLIFEIGQQAFEERGVVAARNMARLAEFGFRFSIDKVTDLDIDLSDARRAGVKFMKASGGMLIDRLNVGEPLGLSIAPELRAEDYANLLAKYGVELIAEKVEDEATVVEVLDLDVGLAQGHLFGPPKPIREGVLAEADAAHDRAEPQRQPHPGPGAARRRAAG